MFLPQSPFTADLHGTIFGACDKLTTGLRHDLGPIYTVRFLSHATTAYDDMIYDCCVRQKKGRSILKHAAIVSHVVGLS